MVSSKWSSRWRGGNGNTTSARPSRNGKPSGGWSTPCGGGDRNQAHLSFTSLPRKIPSKNSFLESPGFSAREFRDSPTTCAVGRMLSRLRKRTAETSGGAMPQTPFRNHSLPGRIEVGDFDEGGEGVGYHDLTPETGNDYRPGTAIDLKPRPGGQWATVDTQAGEWTAYTVRVPFGGVYRCEVLVSTDRSPGAFRVQVDGVDAIPITPAPNTGSRDVYVWVGVPGIRLSSGAHVVKLLTERESSSVEAMRSLSEVFDL